MATIATLIAFVAGIPSGLKSFIAFMRSPIGRILGVAGIVALAYGSGFVRGQHRAEAACDAATARAEAAALRIDRDSQAARADHATRVLAFLQGQDVKNQEEIEALRQQVAVASLQSTKPGAKKDDQALMDDRCNLTERGARGLR